jgi:hypothetical protein
MALNIEYYRNRLEQFEEDLNRELYQFYAGFKSRLELVRCYSGHSDIFSLDSIREVESEYNNESFDSRRNSLGKIRDFLIDQHLDARLAQLTQEIFDFEAQQKIVWEGQGISFSQASLYLKKESDGFKRRNLSERYAREIQKSESLRMESVFRLQSAAGGLGFKNYAQAREQIGGVECRKLLDSLDAALQPLEDKYMERLRESFEISLGRPFQESGSWDIAYWKMTNDAEQVFSKDNLLPIVQATVSDLGIQPERPDSVSIDLDYREGKKTGKLCIPIRIPHEIKIVMLPENGAGQYGSLLHEIGHAYHFAWTSPSLPVEHRIMGDRALSESYAFLLEHFIRDREWLARILSFIKSKEFLRFQALYRFFLIRQCAGRLRLAIDLFEREAFAGMPEIYSETMKTYTGLAHQPEFWIQDLANGYYSADYLRGWMCEAMLREYLRTRFGNSWIMNRAAAGFLKEIWETGQLYSADELCREIGIGDLNSQVLVDEIVEGLRS